MRNRTVVNIFGLIVLLGLSVPLASAQFQPSVGQEGKDVIWVPTPQELITSMLDMAKVTASDYIIDLGSGDGRIVIAAAKRGARGLGVEFNPDMVALSKSNAAKEGVADKANFTQADIFETDFSKATVVTMYLLPHLNLKLRPKILDMKPGTRVVSHAFTMEDWEADQTADADGRMAYLWIVPAKVGGTWTMRGSSTGEITLNQKFQRLDGTVKLDGKPATLNGKMDGDRITFFVGTTEYSGRVNGKTIEGTVKAANGTASKWTAERQTVQ
jgi:SAM-dependent methyltransferase